MGLQVKKLLVMFVLLVFAILSLCEAKKATVEVVGLIHCSDCLKNHSTITNSSQGFDVLITCNSRKNETKTQGNGGVDKQGKFNVTLSLSAEIQQDSTQIDGCYAKLQSRSGAPCHIQQPQTASVKIISNGENEAVTLHTPTVIKFSPLTCQSAFFWLFPNLTFFGSPPSPPEYTPPPSPEVLPPVQPPLPPPENSSPPPQPADDPLLPPPEIEAPSPPPSAGPVAAPPPTYQNPTDPEIGCPSPPPQEVPLPLPSSPLPPPPSSPVYNKPPSPAAAPPLPPPPSSPVYNKPPSPAAAPPLPPPINGPIQSPSPPKRRNQTPPTTVIAPPTPALSSSPPRPLPSPGKAIQPPPSATIPGRRRPSPIPKAPPIPRLPVTPSIPRKYFNAPNSKSKPPRSV